MSASTSSTSQSPQDAIQHVVSTVLSSDAIPITDFFTDYVVFDINAFLTLDDSDFKTAYRTSSSTTLKTLSNVLVKKLVNLQRWYASQVSPDVSTWFKLTADDFQAWCITSNLQRFSISPVVPSAPVPSTPTIPSFRSSIKVNISDYVKLQNDSQWRVFNRQLRATAAIHDTLDVLDPSFIPLPGSEAVFEQKSKFMYNVFSQCILSSKGKVCVRSHERTLDGQLVYSDLLDVYTDQLSAQIDATTLRSELTIMKLDDKWRKSYESFLNFWLSRVQDLESIEDRDVDDDTKRIWLTTTLSNHKDMNGAIRQAFTTEITLSGINGTTAQLPWDHFYRMVLSTAKLLDSASPKLDKQQQRQANKSEQNNSGRGRGNRNGGRGNGGRGGNNNNQNQHNTTFTKYTGAQMVMEAKMSFSRDDWKKLTDAQKAKLKELKANAKAKAAAQSNNTTSYSNHNATQSQSNSYVAPSSSSSPAGQSSNGIRNVLSNNTSRVSFQQNTCQCTYSINQHQAKPSGALVDGGANGGLSGSDVRVLSETLNFADVTGIGEKSLTNLPLCTVGAVIQTHTGPIIGIFNQYAHFGKGKTVHSVNQLKYFGIIIDDTPRQFGGKQRLATPEGYYIPLSIRNGLPYFDMHPPTDDELHSYPHVIFTSDIPWDPQVLDDEYNVHDLELNEDDFIKPSYHPNALNAYGEIHPFQHDDPDLCTYHTQVQRFSFDSNKHVVGTKQHDFERLAPNFAFVPAERIKQTIDHTTQFARLDTRLPLRKHFKSRFPAANISRLNETVATDTFFFDIPALDDGIMGHGGTEMLQLYCGCASQLTAVYPMKTETDMSGTLEDFIRQHGAPNALFSDNAKSQIGRAVQEILRMYAIKDFQCEPHHQHQNPAERRIQEVKKLSNQMLDRTGAPPNLWLLCVYYVVYLLNRLSSETLDWKTPIEAATGQQPDISAIISFRWYEPVYYKSHSSSYPSSSNEKLGRIVGVAEHKGDALTFLVLDTLNNQVLARSELRSAVTVTAPNIRAEFLGNSSPDGVNPSSAKPILSATDIADLDINPSDLKLPRFSPDELIGKLFVRDLEDGKSYRARVVRKIMDQDAENHKNIKFLVELGDGEFDEIITYNKLCNMIEEIENQEDHPEEPKWTFKSILSHQGPLKKNHPDYKGSMYNVLVQWEDGSNTYEPLQLMIEDDPISLALYARKNNLLTTPGWKRLNHIAQDTAKARNKIRSMLHQYHVCKGKRTNGPVYKFGIQVPRNVKEAHVLDSKNGNTKWNDAMQEEIDSLLGFDTFVDKGKIPFLAGSKNIIVHFVFDIKHDFRHKARLVAGGHLTDPNIDGTYSGVVSLRTMRIALVSAELNCLKIMVGDVTSAYLEAFTNEKVCFIAGPEFGALHGHLLVIERALYGLRTSGARWHDRLADVLRDMGYFQCKADPDLWILDGNTHYEYVLVYVDDLMCIGKNPQQFFDALINKYHFKLKGVGTPTYHLGGDFFRDSDGTLAWGATSYVKKMVMNYEVMFGQKPTESSSPISEKDHPELDLSPELDENGIKQYQSLIGALQWLITLGRFDILVAVSTMSSYRVAPREGHLDRLKRIFGYVKKNSDGAIRFRVNIPDHESQGIPHSFDWSSRYENVSEELPHDMPIPKGKVMRTTTYEDANLYHDMVTGRSVTGILHLLNQTPIHWHSKRQGRVQTATYGSEFMAARTASEQIIDLRYTLRMMGIPIDGPSWMFGDNQSVITSATIPESTLNKRHNALSYHLVRECIAAKIINFMHVPGKVNPSDLLTKFLSWANFWPLIQPLLFWKGETLLTKPLALIIQEIKDPQDPPTGLRGVSDGINPSTGSRRSKPH
jgi:hypothetical protein